MFTAHRVKSLGLAAFATVAILAGCENDDAARDGAPPTVTVIVSPSAQEIAIMDAAQLMASDLPDDWRVAPPDGVTDAGDAIPVAASGACRDYLEANIVLFDPTDQAQRSVTFETDDSVETMQSFVRIWSDTRPVEHAEATADTASNVCDRDELESLFASIAQEVGGEAEILLGDIRTIDQGDWAKELEAVFSVAGSSTMTTTFVVRVGRVPGALRYIRPPDRDDLALFESVRLRLTQRVAAANAAANERATP